MGIVLDHIFLVGFYFIFYDIQNYKWTINKKITNEQKTKKVKKKRQKWRSSESKERIYFLNHIISGPFICLAISTSVRPPSITVRLTTIYHACLFFKTSLCNSNFYCIKNTHDNYFFPMWLLDFEKLWRW